MTQVQKRIAEMITNDYQKRRGNKYSSFPKSGIPTEIYEGWGDWSIEMIFKSTDYAVAERFARDFAKAKGLHVAKLSVGEAAESDYPNDWVSVLMQLQ